MQNCFLLHPSFLHRSLRSTTSGKIHRHCVFRTLLILFIDYGCTLIWKVMADNLSDIWASSKRPVRIETQD
ncbi:MAG: hypothetical protein EBY15_11215 [Gammaproteobacteria bacterium]|nr:hypothetical protein [Gammaproteobacteria bacterium]